MKVFYKVLKVLLWCVAGLFACASLYQCYDYITNPEPYMYTSGPWYLGIIIYGILAAIIILVILLAMWIIRIIGKKRGEF